MLGALARGAGNSAACRAVEWAGSAPATLQRTVHRPETRNPLGPAYTAADVGRLEDDLERRLARWRIDDPATFGDAAGHIAVGEFAQAIMGSPFFSDGVEHTLMEAARAVYPQLEEDAVRRRAPAVPASDITLGAIQARAVVEPPRPVPATPANPLDLSGADINITAAVDVDVPESAAAAGWTIGLTQTGISVDRMFRLERRDDRGPIGDLEATVHAGQPALDRNADAPAPWYSGSAYQRLKKGRGHVTVALMDRPGDEFSQSGGSLRLTKRRGRDRFVTCLILYNEVTREAIGLREWRWTVDYGNRAGIATTVDSPQGRQIDQLPSELVLDGVRLADALIHEDLPPRRVSCTEGRCVIS